MSLVTREEYVAFGGTEVSVADFPRLESIAEDVVYSACVISPSEEQMSSDLYKKALCYQIEMLQNQGGVDAVVGLSDSDTASERLGDYSITKGSGSAGGKSEAYSLNGIPVSALAVGYLRKLGLMNRWAFAGV